jgi:Putative Flp pilus-assembly TadE/G-like
VTIRRRGWLGREGGQALPMMVLASVLFLGFAGVSVDSGRAFICKRQLQSATDAAALAGAYDMSLSTATTGGVQSFVSNYTSASGAYNASTSMTVGTPTVTLKCLSTVTNWGIYCSSSPTGYNAVQVVQTATVNTMFIRALAVFGLNSFKTINIQAKATAAMRGASNQQYNVALVIDTTASMGSADTDGNCGSTRISCALQGVRTLLTSLSPCTANSTSSSCTGFDQVALFTFPNVQANVSADKTSYSTNDTVCPTSNPTIPYYSTPTAGATWAAPTTGSASYQVTSFLSNYSSTNKPGGALNTSSALTIAAGGKSGCNGLQTPGGDGTYYAGSIYAAQSALVTAQKNNPGSLNALIILSDGAANTTKMVSGTKDNGTTYPSTTNQCQQGINAAKYASSHGTTVYTIAYGASTAGGKSQCTTDATLSPCSALQQMATSASTFYSDATTSNKGACTSTANPNLTLNQIFKQVATTFTVARLIPDGTT